MKLLCTLLLLNIWFFLSAESLSLNTADTAPYSTKDNYGFYDVLLTEVMQNLNYDLKINHYPSERSILWANEGHDDGEFARISGLSETYTNLHEVEEPLVTFKFVALKMKENSFSPTSWEELKDLRVGYLHGWKIYENNVGEGNKISILYKIDNMFNMLLENRLDIILYSELRSQEFINEHGIEEIEIIETPLSIRPMHLYMHKQHADLITKINNELINLKSSGRYDEIFHEYLQK